MEYKIYQIRHKVPGKESISDVIVTLNMEIIYTCYLVELPWEYNQPYISCIPADTYTLEKVDSSPSFKYPHFEVKNVPGRTGIKWHVANYASQLKGCGGPGISLEDLNKDDIIDVKASRQALNELLSILPDKSQLIIIEA